ncbi:MAG: hypothetical protein J0M12_16945 [Deltaproteobacteria bacterium]|nr:hypothetical protein [Deltaproteobacteria bacterium]
MFAPEILTPAARSKLAHEATDKNGPVLAFPVSLDTTSGTISGLGQITKSLSGVDRSHIVNFSSSNQALNFKASLDHEGNLIRVTGTEHFAPLKPEQIADTVLRAALKIPDQDFRVKYTEAEFREAAIKSTAETARRNDEPHELSWGRRPNAQQLEEICALVSALQFEPYTRQLSIDPSFAGANVRSNRRVSIVAYGEYNVVVFREGKGLSVVVGNADVDERPFQLLRLKIQGIQNGQTADFEVGHFIRQARLSTIDRSSVIQLKATVIEEPAEMSMEKGAELFAALRERLGTGDSYSTLGERNLSPILMAAPLGASDDTIGLVFINQGAARSCRVFEDGRVEVIDAADVCTFDELLVAVTSGIASVHPADSGAGSLCRGIVQAYCTGEALGTDHLEFFARNEEEAEDPVTAEEVRGFYETTAVPPTKLELEILQRLVAEPFRPTLEESEVVRSEGDITLVIRSHRDLHSNMFSQVSIRAYRDEAENRVPLDLEYAQIQVASFSAQRQHPLSEPGYYLGEVAFTDLRTEWDYQAYLP